MRALLSVALLLMACPQRGASWGSQPVSCDSAERKIGVIESYVIEGKTRGVQFRHVPDVLSGSSLIEKQGRLVLEQNEIGVADIAAYEYPTDASVRLVYKQTLLDGGVREVDEWLRCQPMTQK